MHTEHLISDLKNWKNGFLKTFESGLEEEKEGTDKKLRSRIGKIGETNFKLRQNPNGFCRTERRGVVSAPVCTSAECVRPSRQTMW